MEDNMKKDLEDLDKEFMKIADAKVVKLGHKETAIKGFLAFIKWRKGLDVDIGEKLEDWVPWWVCFSAGYQAASQDGL